MGGWNLGKHLHNPAPLQYGDILYSSDNGPNMLTNSINNFPIKFLLV